MCGSAYSKRRSYYKIAYFQKSVCVYMYRILIRKTARQTTFQKYLSLAKFLIFLGHKYSVTAGFSFF